MSDGIYAALSGAVAQQRSLDIVANNVANANTAGFRADRVAFDEVLREQVGGANVPQSAREQGPRQAQQALRFVSADRVTTTFDGGTLQQTQNPLDLAIGGEGFFSVQTPAGERYTRAGNFLRDVEGRVHTQDGHPLLDTNNRPVQIPLNTREVRIDRTGVINADGVDIARVKVSTFPDLADLCKEGNTLFNARTSQPVHAAQAEVHQGYLETSNVNPVSGLNELITTSRLFDTFQKVIQGYRDMDQRAARDLGSRNS